MIKRVGRKVLQSMAHRIAHVVADDLSSAQEASQTRLLQRDERAAPVLKAALRSLIMDYQARVMRDLPLPAFRDCGFRVFSQFDEDGLILFLLAVVGIGPRRYVEIGCSDGVFNSNCANLAINLGFHGFGVDGDEQAIAQASESLARHPDTYLYPPIYEHAMVTRDNINSLIEGSGFAGEVDLLSIDIDGNDYWVWEAIECITPRVVVIETHVEFGNENIVVPYDENYVYPGKHPEYHGASPSAMVALAKRKGYRLVGANRFGFNTFFLRSDLAQGVIPTIEPEEVLQHPRNAERAQLFDEIRDWDYARG